MTKPIFTVVRIVDYISNNRNTLSEHLSKTKSEGTHHDQLNVITITDLDESIQTMCESYYYTFMRHITYTGTEEWLTEVLSKELPEGVNHFDSQGLKIEVEKVTDTRLKG
jgi:hypothetical protein